MEWVDKLQVPGLVLAGVVIWLLFKLLGRMLDVCLKMIDQRAEDRSLLTEMSGMLRQLCHRDREKKE